MRCTPQKCPSLSCTNPALVGCCQTCTECSINGVRYQNGQNVPIIRDSCSKCICNVSTVLQLLAQLLITFRLLIILPTFCSNFLSYE